LWRIGGQRYSPRLDRPARSVRSARPPTRPMCRVPRHVRYTCQSASTCNICMAQSAVSTIRAFLYRVLDCLQPGEANPKCVTNSAFGYPKYFPTHDPNTRPIFGTSPEDSQKCVPSLLVMQTSGGGPLALASCPHAGAHTAEDAVTSRRSPHHATALKPELLWGDLGSRRRGSGGRRRGSGSRHRAAPPPPWICSHRPLGPQQRTAPESEQLRHAHASGAMAPARPAPTKARRRRDL
jgi:hypothetical protein